VKNAGVCFDSECAQGKSIYLVINFYWLRPKAHSCFRRRQFRELQPETTLDMSQKRTAFPKNDLLLGYSPTRLAEYPPEPD